MILEIGIDARCLACQIGVHPDLPLSHPSLSRQIRVDIDVYLTYLSGTDPDLTAREDDMTKVGYARVSTLDQNTDNQEARLRAAGCTIIRKEKVSGRSREGRDELATVIQFLRAGDVVVVTKLDRLGRNTRDVLNLVHEIDAMGAHLQVLEPEITTEGEMGKVMITILSMVAEMELNRLRERREEGIAAAKVRGVYKGGIRQTDYSEVKKLVEMGLSKAEVARRMGISRETVYQALRAGEALKQG